MKYLCNMKSAMLLNIAFALPQILPQLLRDAIQSPFRGLGLKNDKFLCSLKWITVLPELTKTRILLYFAMSKIGNIFNANILKTYRMLNFIAISLLFYCFSHCISLLKNQRKICKIPVRMAESGGCGNAFISSSQTSNRVNSMGRAGGP
jgi:hypothetical protein